MTRHSKNESDNPGSGHFSRKTRVSASPNWLFLRGTSVEAVSLAAFDLRRKSTDGPANVVGPRTSESPIDRPGGKASDDSDRDGRRWRRFRVLAGIN